MLPGQPEPLDSLDPRLDEPHQVALLAPAQGRSCVPHQQVAPLSPSSIIAAPVDPPIGAAPTCKSTAVPDNTALPDVSNSSSTGQLFNPNSSFPQLAVPISRPHSPVKNTAGLGSTQVVRDRSPVVPHREDQLMSAPVLSRTPQLQAATGSHITRTPTAPMNSLRQVPLSASTSPLTTPTIHTLKAFTRSHPQCSFA